MGVIRGRETLPKVAGLGSGAGFCKRPTEVNVPCLAGCSVPLFRFSDVCYGVAQPYLSALGLSPLNAAEFPRDCRKETC